MIEPKPLSEEERAWFLERSCEPSMPNGDVVRKLLAAEAYERQEAERWRMRCEALETRRKD